MPDAHAEGLTSAKPFHFSLENSKTSLACYETAEILERCYYRANGLDFHRLHLNRQLNDCRLSRLAPTVEWLNEASGPLRDARMRATVQARSVALGVSAVGARLDPNGMFGSDQ